ncbi:hypothetical protein KY334_07345 [Candidatus Woesearchaeota archaeon]|nr:hypothetical protein [Candidatus Woesearchaeota archaeon]
MQGKVKIEYLPKLDKVLRVTFASIKKDLNETKEDFEILREEVGNFSESFKEKLDKHIKSVTKSVDSNYIDLDKRITDNFMNLEKQINKLGKLTETFVKQTNDKVTKLAKESKKVDSFKILAEELQSEIKTLKLLRSDIDKIKVIESSLENVEEISVNKKDFDKKFISLKGDIDKKLSNYKVENEYLVKKTKDDLEKEKKDISKKIDKIDQKISQHNDSYKENISKMESISKDSKEYVNSEIKKIKDEFNSTVIKNKSDVEDIRNIHAKFSKDIDEFIKEKDLDKKMSKLVENKEVKEIAKQLESEFKTFKKESIDELKKKLISDREDYDEKIKSLEEMLNKERSNVADLESDLNILKKAITKLETKVSIKPTVIKKVTTKKPNNKVEEIISKKVDKKPSLFKRFIDFLVEEVDVEEEEKDKRLQEFDRKKGDKFEIKEIRELK